MANTKSRWRVVYDDLRRHIDQGKLQPGDTIPGELDLADLHSVSRQTVRVALTHLQQEGVLTEGAGRLGRQVREHQPLVWHLTNFERGTRRDDPTHGMDAWSVDMTDQGKEPRQEIEVSALPAPPRVAAWLDVSVGQILVRRRRIRYADNDPVTIADTWVEQDIADRECEVNGQLLKPIWSPYDITLPQGFINAIGINQVRFWDEIHVRMPTPEESHVLELQTGSPVGEHSRIGIDDTDRRVRVIVSVFPGNRLHLAYDLDV